MLDGVVEWSLILRVSVVDVGTELNQKLDGADVILA